MPTSSKAKQTKSGQSLPRLSEHVYESLSEMILKGTLPPGQPVSELELARTLKVSRTPVHEAIKQLVKDGLVSQSANRRPVVVAFGSEDIQDVYEMRKILESAAAAKAARQIDLQTLARLELTLEQFQKQFKRAGAIQRWVKLDDEFHAAIATASGSSRLAADINRYRQLHRVFNRTHTDAAVLKQAVDEHERILTAIKKRDSDAASEAMRVHLEEWQRFFVNHLRQRSGASCTP